MRQATAARFFKAFSLKTIAAGLIAAVMSLAPTAATAADSRYAAIVVDANTGKTLFSANSNSRRYPASLTKMMTLYLTFEAMKQGRIKKSTPVRFSSQAAAQPPTKLGVKAGKSISVETAIYSLITRSANDSAEALAELLGGSEAGFARMMTSKARALGMEGTVFRNPHGLPNTAQFTTARDMATLGMALREHFPQYYSYFSVRSFTYGKQRIANHNRLLGKIKGVDGIKTGYTRASGFNLVSSVSDGNRRIVAVVMGGQSAASRDRQMAGLIEEYLPKASSRKGGPLVANANNSTIMDVAKAILSKKKAPTPQARPDDDQDAEVAAFVERTEEGRPATKAAAKIAAAETTATAVVEEAYATPRPSVDVDTLKTASVEPSGWVIQVASSPSKAEAAKALEAAARKAPQVLAAASSYTVPYDKDGVTYHRARFAGFDTKAAAWKACSQLKKKDMGCYAVQN
ncbi:D-alanyl-D-alanine carboxypeptidase [Mesorhizobium sp. LHD-90]|uniref:D-alanyl-D-alanine carboxypeptidase n=1 Tax=Mesorhizobium sp. LHD-90 TaxID=3071414 RepID=UPI0027E21668|nr:D-alanyl-D-alanine carboxypeptidase [Mesorhizobium sp. LHD-90]MDQ6437753.1 D-alanyl-D-alanine carboxypeptidase [Mesorhizobium sp. LHD-90]